MIAFVCELLCLCRSLLGFFRWLCAVGCLAIFAYLYFFMADILCIQQTILAGFEVPC
jgi:hypothetical protein